MANNKPYSIKYTSRAQKEIAKAWEWYEDRQQGLGDRFINEMMRRVQLIEQDPYRYPSRYKSYKETPL